MAEVEIKVKIDGVEYTQEQLKELATGAKKAGEGMEDLGDKTKKAGEEATIFGDIKKKFSDMTGGIMKVVRSFKTLKGAIAATGIGLLITALGSLAAYFTSTEEGSRKLAIATETLSILWGKLIETAAGLGKKIMSVFQDPVQAVKDLGKAIVDNIVERFNSLLDVLGYVASAFKNLFAGEFTKAWEDVKAAGEEMVDVFTGVDNSVEKLTTGVKTFYNEVKTAVESAVNAATRLVDAQRALRDQQQKLIVENAMLNKELETQQKIAEDTTRTYEERKAALEKVGEAQVKLAENVAAQAKNEEALLKLQIQTANSYEEREELETQLAEATASRIEAETALELKKLEVSKITAELELEELDRKRSINDAIQNLELSTLENKRLAAFEALRIAEEAALAELETLKATEEEKQRIRDGYAKLRTQLEKSTSESELEITRQTLGSVGEAFGEGTEAYKAFKIAETGISTYSSATKAYESAVAVPVIGPVLGPIAAAAAIASGLKTVKQIMNTQLPETPQYAFGGYVNGPSHSAGGQMINAEGGEFILNKYAMRQPGVGQIAEALNGIATPASQSPGMMPIKTYVVATEVSSAQEANSKVEKLARL